MLAHQRWSFWRRAVRWLAAAWNGRFGDAELAIFFDFMPPPYGGGNQFLLALKGELERQGVAVGVNYVGPRTRAVLVNSMQVDEAFLAHASAGRTLRVVHRVDGPISTYRGQSDAALDRGIAELNLRIAQATVLQSRFSADAHDALGIHFVAPSVIPNAPDPTLFFPPPSRSPLAGRKLRIISTAWSDNALKGAATYRWLDEHLDLEQVEYTFVGRVGADLKRIRVVPPVASAPLGELLRAHDVYLTASLNDPCSNALLEALACGLPAIHALSGGHPELVGAGGLGFRDPAEIPALIERMRRELDEFRARIRAPALADVARRYRMLLEGDVLDGDARG